jgi:hypothetical protein
VTGILTVIRCSALTGWPDCPRRGAARLFWREITAAGYQLHHTVRSIGAAIGTAVHRGAAVELGEKARSGKLPPESVALDAANETMRDQIREGVTYDGPTGATHNQLQAERQVISMARVYHGQVAPGINALLVEERLEAEVAPGLVLSGAADTIAREPGAIRDLKTGLRRSTHAPQLGGYSLLARSNNLPIEQAGIDFIQRVAIARPQPDAVSTSVPIEQAETAASNVVRHIAGSLEVFRHGDAERRIMPGDPWAFLANPNSVLCSPKYCPAFGTEFCKEGDPSKAR